MFYILACLITVALAQNPVTGLCVYCVVLCCVCYLCLSLPSPCVLAFVFCFFFFFLTPARPRSLAECAKMTNCCTCAALTKYACVWDTNVARKRDVEQTAACTPNAARKRNADGTVADDGDANEAHELAKRAIIASPAMCPCGDGNRCAAANEMCDDGKMNGTPQSCCTTSCTPKADGTVCAAKQPPLSASLTANNLCDADDVCRAGVCAPTVVPASPVQVSACFSRGSS